MMPLYLICVFANWIQAARLKVLDAKRQTAGLWFFYSTDRWGLKGKWRSIFGMWNWRILVNLRGNKTLVAARSPPAARLFLPHSVSASPSSWTNNNLYDERLNMAAVSDEQSLPYCRSVIKETSQRSLLQISDSDLFRLCNDSGLIWCMETDQQ